MAQSLLDYFSLTHSRKLIVCLKKAGLNFKDNTVASKNSLLSGKTVVFTGELKEFSRAQAEEIVRSFGANTSSAISKNTDFLVAGENPGSKFAKANKLAVKIIYEEEFLRLMEDK